MTANTASSVPSWHMTMGAGVAGLELRRTSRPRPGPGEVLVRVRAVSLNYRELSILLHGRYPLPIKPGVIAVADGAGEVAELGPGVTRVALGEKVLASVFPYWIDGPFHHAVAAQLGGSLDGMASEFALVPAEALMPLPPHLSFEEAATLPCAALTAWNALFGGKHLRPGNTVLVLGSGNVSLFALQFARIAGLSTFATTSSAAKADVLRGLGADVVINYREHTDWGAQVRQLSDGGVDQVVEIGGAGTISQSLQAVAHGGELAFVGTRAEASKESGDDGRIDPATIFVSGATVRSLAVGSRAQLAAMLAAITQHGLRPLIAEVFDFDRLREAFAHYAQAQPLGKVVIRINPQ